MSFNWSEKANEQGKGSAAKLPEGSHKGVTISKLIFGGKDSKFTNKEGDPQVMVIVSDSQEREASSMFTLNEKYGWALAKLCDAAGLNLEKMTKSGITPDKFADETFAKKNLEGRKLDVEVVHSGKYANFTPLRADTAEADFSQEEEIPVQR